MGSKPDIERTGRIQRMSAGTLDVQPDATQRALPYARAAVPREDLATVMAALGTDDLRVWVPAEVPGAVEEAAGRGDRCAAARALERARTGRPTDACATRPKAG